MAARSRREQISAAGRGIPGPDPVIEVFLSGRDGPENSLLVTTAVVDANSILTRFPCGPPLTIRLSN